MKKIFTMLIVSFGLYGSESPSYHCVNTYEASFTEFDGSIKPKITKASGRSKLNIILEEDKNKEFYLNVNGNKLLVTGIKDRYIYAIEFTAGGMHTWVLFENKKNKKNYLTVSKTYDLLGIPLTNYSLYDCEKVNNKF